ncbi:MAG: pYEATS domain-containing protein [Vicinamibacterales bacterium]
MKILTAIAVLAMLARPAYGEQLLGVSAANTSRYLGGEQWEWTIFVTGPAQLLNTIQRVEYTLHPTFANRVQAPARGSDPAKAFPFTATGWGVFVVGIKVTLANGETQNLRHMLKFVATQKCSDQVTLHQRRYQLIPDPRFRNDVYVYVGDIADKWRKTPTHIVLFTAEDGSWGQSGSLSETEFAGRLAKNPRWTMKAQAGNESIEFNYRGAAYMLGVTDRQTMPLPDRIRVQVCDK